MRSILLLGCIFWCLCLPLAALAEEDEGLEWERAERHFEVQEREMELEHHRAELRHKAEMRELELQQRRIEMERFGHDRNRGIDQFKPLLLVCLVVHILTAVWVYQDIRRRNAGSGLWIVITLLSGLIGALVYAVVRLGDVKQTSESG